jgi:hypothetical protein
MWAGALPDVPNDRLGREHTLGSVIHYVMRKKKKVYEVTLLSVRRPEVPW